MKNLDFILFTFMALKLPLLSLTLYSTIFYPKEYMHNYHWINAGVDSTPGHILNPLDSILRNYNKDDFAVIKVDIDTADIEVPLVHQLLEDVSLHGGLVDQFYFEHHVKFKEMTPIWRSAMRGSLKDTFDLFYGLRQRGIRHTFGLEYVLVICIARVCTL